MQNCWLVRAGEGSRHAVRFATGGVIAVGWDDVPGLGDLHSHNQSEIAALLRANGSKPAGAASEALELVTFRDDLEVGDVVVTPDAPVRQLLVGEITSKYEYRESAPVGDFKHVRTVDWYGRCSREGHSEALNRDTKYRRTLRGLEDNRDEWLALAQRMKAGDALPINSPGRSHRPASSGASTRKPVPPEAETRVCATCGMRVSAAQFVAGSDLCVDCRRE
jgi:predicted Mrr-cat superfamily restriction endonuclease